MITLAHEFISPNESFTCTNDILAEVADHSADINMAHYAIVHSALPCMTNNEMNKHLWHAEEWGSLLGLGPILPPEPVHAVHRKTHSTKTTEGNELAAQIVAQVVEVVMNRLIDLGLTQNMIDILECAASKQLSLPERKLNEHLSFTPSTSYAARFPEESQLFLNLNKGSPQLAALSYLSYNGGPFEDFETMPTTPNSTSMTGMIRSH